MERLAKTNDMVESAYAICLCSSRSSEHDTADECITFDVSLAHELLVFSQSIVNVVLGFEINETFARRVAILAE